MEIERSTPVTVERIDLNSAPLERVVPVDIYRAGDIIPGEKVNLLLINDGQDLVSIGFEKMLAGLSLQPLVCVGIHCGEDRKNEYGMLCSPDYAGRGSKAAQYQQFIFDELLPYLESQFHSNTFNQCAFAGFSLGGLNALDMVWNHPDKFSKAGVFSGSLWWRSKDKEDKEYNDQTSRLMHSQIRNSAYRPGLKFFFECGELDETEDRNKNGVIDSIDDTIDLMKDLLAKGYLEGTDMVYLQIPDGKHDIATWAKALPYFLKWGWGRRS
jgi:enterochelin esterase-like enzyme